MGFNACFNLVFSKGSPSATSAFDSSHLLHSSLLSKSTKQNNLSITVHS